MLPIRTSDPLSPNTRSSADALGTALHSIENIVFPVVDPTVIRDNS